MNARQTLAILLPFAACAVQWLLWDYITPYVWFLFFPAAFFSAWLGGLRGGLAGTLIGAMLVWYIFMPPPFSFTLDDPASAFSIVVFVFMGGFFAFFFERLAQAMLRTAKALAAEQAAGEARDSAAMLREAQRLAGIGNWRWDVGNDTHSWSEEIYRIYGRDPALPPAVYPEVQQYFTAESWANLATAVEKAMAQGLPYECDAEVVRPDGGHRWIIARGEATRDAAGKIVNLHGTVQDITERKLAEMEIHQLNTELEQRVEERTAELASANRELDAFAYAVSHDLRAPLRAMSGFSQALIEDYGAQLQGEARVYLEQIDLASRKMSALIDGILVLSRSTRGELQRDRIDLSALATRLLDSLAAGEPARQVTAEIESGLEARGDIRMIEAALGNLLDNAWKYCSKAVTPHIRVYAGEVEGQRGFCVADNGAGFDMAHASRLFQPFQRLHRQDEFPGIGIGLATVQRIIHRHGGMIVAHGEPGKGATFCFTLPEIHPDTAREEKEP